MQHFPTTNRFETYWSKSIVYLFVFFFILLSIIRITSGYDYYLSEVFWTSLLISIPLWICFPIWWLGIIVSIKFLRAIFTMIDDYLENLEP